MRADLYISSRNKRVVLSFLRTEDLNNWKPLVLLCRCHGNILDLTHTAGLLAEQNLPGEPEAAANLCLVSLTSLSGQAKLV